MSRFGTQYQVSRHTGICAATGRRIEPGETVIATLCERPEDEGLDRRDFSVDAWEAGARPDHLFSYWKTQMAEPGGERKLLVDDDVLMDLFERLAEDDRPQRVAFRFVLALILMRKRLLRFVGRREQTTPLTGAVPRTGRDEGAKTGGAALRKGGVEYWRFKQRGADADDPPIEVVNPHLIDDDVRELTAQLSEVLQGEL